jgi:acetyl-CoA carboxylase biotin carboxyl carrier protein
MNLKEIKEIIDLMNQHELTEIEIEREGVKLKIKKSSSETGEPVIRHHLEPPVPPSPVTPASPASPAAQSTGKATKTITSPMVGTFYRAPSPEAPPFVEVGKIVEVGQVVCILEAMKLMNEIKSEIKGRIVEIAVENAEPVEFGQTLFVLEPV